MQDCHYISIIEDDLVPQEKGWFEIYEEAASLTNIHHFCRIADEKAILETYPAVTSFLKTKNMTPIYGPSPRGDFTFITCEVIKKVGAFHPGFRGAGYAHGEWSGRIAEAGLISHPLKWIDIKEARDKFIQKGDTAGGRWNYLERTKAQIKANKVTLRHLQKTGYIFHPLVLL